MRAFRPLRAGAPFPEKTPYSWRNRRWTRRDQDFAALESRLPAAESDTSVGEPFDEGYGPAPANRPTNPYDQPIEASRSVPARQIPMLTAALVLAACLSAGAATAAFLVQDELPRLSALLPAIR